MNDLLSYKNYNGTIEYSDEDGCFFGKVMGVNSLISYEGSSLQELESGFEEAVDDYLQHCKAKGLEPEQPYKISVSVNISFDLYNRITSYATRKGRSLSSIVEEAIVNVVR